MEALAALTLATAEFERRLAAVPPSRWQAPTPCEEWTVRDIVNHITGGNRFAVLILGGASVDDAIAQVRSGDFSEDPLTAFHKSAGAQIDAFSRPGAMVDLCYHQVGQILGQQFAGLRMGDLLVHGWDIARAVDGDENLDEELVREAFTVYEPLAEGFLDTGAFGSGPRFTADDLSQQSRLLHLFGRHV